jgi:hypothetical protein
MKPPAKVFWNLNYGRIHELDYKGRQRFEQAFGIPQNKMLR